MVISQVIALTLLGPVQANPDLRKIESSLDKIAKGFHGRMGYHVIDLRSGRSFGHRGEERFPSASTIKTVLMIEAFKQIEEGRLHWKEKLTVPPVGSRNGSMWVSYMIEGTKIDIDGLVNLMMSVSDNTATVMLSNKLGVENLEKRLLSWGYKDTAVTINVPASNQRLTRLRQTFANMGVTSPVEIATILRRVVDREIASPAACDKMLRIMTHQYWDDSVAWCVPVEVAVAGKVGALERSRSEVAVVFGPRPYIFAAYTDNAADRRWTEDNEGNVKIREMATSLWNGMNPNHPFKPKHGADRWWPTGGVDSNG